MQNFGSLIAVRKQQKVIKNAVCKQQMIVFVMYQINWDAQLIAIKGPRGVGKTTLMLQYMKQHYEIYSREVLYCTLDSVYFSNHTLLELVDVFVKNGGKHLFLDEVHKYPTWSKEIRYIESMGYFGSWRGRYNV